MPGPLTIRQVVVDCVDPHRLVSFWAEALGYEVERHGPMVQALLDAGAVTADQVLEVDGEPAFKEAAVCSDPEGTPPRLLFQVVAEPRTAKNRVHLDVVVGGGDGQDLAGRAAEVARLEGLGATKLWDGQQGPQTWVTMADPEGNEFCVA